MGNSATSRAVLRRSRGIQTRTSTSLGPFCICVATLPLSASLSTLVTTSGSTPSSEKALTRSALTRLVVTHEHRQEFGTAVKDSRGNIQMIIPKTTLSLFSKIIAITCTYDALTSRRPYRDSYGPQIALMLMWTEMRNRFDPEILRVFMNAMAIQPIKMVRNRTVSMG